MSDSERSDFLFFVGTVSAAVVVTAVTILMAFAALSPEISIDIPGIDRCRGGSCFGGGGD